MVFFHCYPAAAIADEFHGCQFVFADVFLIDAGRATKTAILFVTTRVAKVSRLVGHSTTAFTRIGHIYPL
jgi:hypothetical protein